MGKTIRKRKFDQPKPRKQKKRNRNRDRQNLKDWENWED